MSQQINNEYAFAKHHTVLTLRDGLEKDMGTPVADFVKKLYAYFSETDFSYTTKAGVIKNWDTKELRYMEMSDLSDNEMLDLAWTVVVHCICKPRTTITEVIGKFYKKLPHDDRMGLETASEIIGVLDTTPFITVIYPNNAEEGVLMIQSNVDLDEDLKVYLNNQRFVLPSLVPPKELTCNTDTGYQTISGSVILSGKHHEHRVNLAHLNRQNAIALCMDERVLRTVEPKFKEKDETEEERAKRFEAWVKLNKDCVGIYAQFVGRDFYLTHKFDERERTYVVGHEFNTQGDDYRRSSLELATPELVQC